MFKTVLNLQSLHASQATFCRQLRRVPPARLDVLLALQPPSPRVPAASMATIS